MSAAEWSDGAAGPVLNLFDELTDPGGWQDKALCAEIGWAMFFPEKGEPAKPARLVCAMCPVRDECLAFALDVESRPGVDGRHGIYGGLIPRERAAIARQRKQAAA